MTSGDAIRELSGAEVLVDRPRKLVFTWIGPRTDHRNTLVIVELEPQGDETDLALTHKRLPTSGIVEAPTRGWEQVLGVLAKGLASMREGNSDGVFEG